MLPHNTHGHKVTSPKQPTAILSKNKRKSNRLTRRKLKLQENWPLWQNSEYKQLSQYEDQDTFGPPCPLPLGANVLDLLLSQLQRANQ